MSLSTQSAISSSKSIATTALRSAGLIDRDATMRDATDNAGGRKGRVRSSRAARTLDVNMDRRLGPRTHPMRVSNTHASTSDPLAIRGASRPTVTGRLRRAPGMSDIDARIPVRPVMKTVEAWREFVKKRWNPETRYLNLDSMIDDEIVKKHNLMPPGRGGTIRDASVIFKLAGQLKPDVQTLSLANNNLNGGFLLNLSKYLPNLVNLSLQNNSISDKKEVSMIASKRDKLIHLRELVLIGNPLRDTAYKNGTGGVYRSEVSRRFSSLVVLDQEPIAKISFDAPQPTSSVKVEKPSATSFPYVMGSSFITGVDGSLVSNFLIRFFQIFDSQREALVHVYDPSATFSFSANTSIPNRARISGFHYSRDMPNQRKLEWNTTWLEVGSRNLNRIAGDPQKTLANLHVGGEEIVKVFARLPQTRHDINGPAENFCLDAFPIPHGQNMGLLVSLHGQFTEVLPGGIRSFDRTWMLVPAAEGSMAKLNGWDVSILSDQWIIRPYSSHEAWKQGPLLVQASPGAPKPRTLSLTPQLQPQQPPSFTIGSLPADQQAAVAQLPELQRNLVLQICTQTGLNAKYSHDCLAGNNWDHQSAIANFDAVKATLPRDAFL